MQTRKYVAPPTVAAFLLDGTSRVKGIVGPVGSGKSTGCVIEILRRAQLQAPGHDGVRRSKWLAIRNTTPQLRDTTVRTWLDWCPDGVVGTYFARSNNYYLGVNKRDETDRGTPFWTLPDGTSVAAEILFRALDTPEDASKVLSLDATSIWINEFREIPFSLVTALIARLGRYPSPATGASATYASIVMDSNPSNNESDYARAFSGIRAPEIEKMCRKFGVEYPEFTLYRQPSGLAPNAENIENLPGGRAYYVNMVAIERLRGKDQNWINVHVHGKDGFIADGKAVYSDFWNDNLHRGPAGMQPWDGKPLGIGIDFGMLTSAAVYGQLDEQGRWTIFGELEAKVPGFQDFVQKLKIDVVRRFGRIETVVYGDPAGDVRNVTDARTCYQILRAAGFRVYPSEKLITPRVESVRMTLSRMVGGQPGIMVSPDCKRLIHGFLGGYRNRKIKTSDGRYEETPDKNEYSHVHDALQYLVSYFETPALHGGSQRRWPEPRGEDDGWDNEKPIFAPSDWSAFGNKKSTWR